MPNRKLKIAIISDDSPTRERLVEHTVKMGHIPLVNDPDSVIGGIIGGQLTIEADNWQKPDAIIHRLSKPHRAALHALDAAQKDIPTVNHFLNVLRSADKFSSLVAFTKANIPIPDTVLVSRNKDARLQAELFGYPLIVKEIHGEKGNDVFLVANASQLEDLLANLHKQDEHQFLVQRYIKECKGHDIRALVVGDEVVAAIERRASFQDEFRANLSQGGHASKTILSHQETELALKAAKAVGLEIAGVDILRSEAGPLVIETNSFPGFTITEAVTGADIAEKILEFVVSKVPKS